MKWYECANFYHFYPLAFAKGEYSLSELELWGDHLESLNINAIYLGPLFESKTHGYDTSDYYRVDKRLGDNNTLINLINFYHKRSVKVIIDAVFNHTGKDFFAFKDIQLNREKSKYLNWYKNIDFSQEGESGDGFTYQCWEGCSSLALLNLENTEVVDYLLNVIDFWKTTFKIDGLRFDCAYSLPKSFINKINQRFCTTDENFFLLGEVIHGEYSSYLDSQMLDSVTDYELHQALFNSHNTQNYFELAHTMKRQFEDGKGYQLYNFTDNHDVNRLSSKLENKDHIYLVYALLYTLPGLSSLYYGDEWGAMGEKVNGDDSSLRPYYSITNLFIDNQELLDMIRLLSSFRMNNKELFFKGTLEVIQLSNKFLSIRRKYNNSSIVVYLNCGEDDIAIKEPLCNIIAGRNYYKNSQYFIKGSGFIISKE